MCVDTHTSIETHSQTWEALASVGAISVHTAPVHADPGGFTFIDIFAVAAVGCQLEARFANTLETPVFVNAHPVQTHVSDAALVHVFTVLSVPSDVEARITHAVEAAVCVDAAAVVADPAILQTLVNVSALGPGECALVASSAVAGVGALGVDTFSTSTGVLLTLVHIDALPADVQLEALVALTPVAAWGWNAAPILTEIADQLTVVGNVERQHPWWLTRRRWIRILWWWSRDWNHRPRSKAWRNGLKWRANGRRRVLWSPRNDQRDRAQLVEILS